MNAPIRERLEPWSRLVAAALQLADVDAEDDVQYALAEAGLRRAASAWCASRGWTPPAHSAS